MGTGPAGAVGRPPCFLLPGAGQPQRSWGACLSSAAGAVTQGRAMRGGWDCAAVCEPSHASVAQDCKTNGSRHACLWHCRIEGREARGVANKPPLAALSSPKFKIYQQGGPIESMLVRGIVQDALEVCMSYLCIIGGTCRNCCVHGIRCQDIRQRQPAFLRRLAIDLIDFLPCKQNTTVFYVSV